MLLLTPLLTRIALSFQGCVASGLGVAWEWPSQGTSRLTPPGQPKRSGKVPPAVPLTDAHHLPEPEYY